MKKIVWRNTAISFLISLIVLIAIIYQSSKSTIEDYVTTQAINYHHRVARQFDTLQNIIQYEQQILIDHINSALPDIATQLDALSDDEITTEALQALAIEHQVDHIYVITPDAVVSHSSLIQDIGLDFHAISSDLAAQVKTHYRQGRLSHQNIGISVATKEMNQYSYYGPLESQRIYETSVEFKRYFTTQHGDDFVNYFFNQMVFSNVNDNSFLTHKAIILPLATQELLLNSDNIELSDDILAALERNPIFTKSDQGVLEVATKIALQNSSIITSRHAIIYTRYHLSQASEFINELLFGIALFATFALIIITLTISFTMNRLVIARLSRLQSKIKEFNHGETEQDFTLAGNDEINDIANALQELQVSLKSRDIIIKKQNTELEGIVERRTKELEEEIKVRQIAEKMLQHAATTDPLTGLKNRRVFDTDLENEFNRYFRNKDPYCLMIFDLDHFKKINDQFGHANGDVVLKQVAVKLSSRLRNTDTLARFGGEEFVMILPHTELIHAENLAEHLRLIIAKDPVDISEASVNISCSIGISVVRPDDTNHTDIFNRADEALYVAKDSGRNCVKTK